ncbi:hypothetical protein BG015_000634 [Linnemannia schmuckeri]|uniref:Uncharacterized protein n=1 Tax=Linnemannia schmuckeri TaxID=64567 RepID=A0A9P5S6N4_9FUNG|nr:hypothetical protein BG015_000634 [Linnemannia schmuckeri]
MANRIRFLLDALFDYKISYVWSAVLEELMFPIDNLKNQAMHSALQFVKEHSQLFPGQLVDGVSFVDDDFWVDAPQACPREIRLEVARCLPPLRDVSTVTDENWLQFGAHIKSTDLRQVETIVNRNFGRDAAMSVVLAIDDGDERPFLQRCRDLKSLEIVAGGARGRFKWVVEEKQRALGQPSTGLDTTTGISGGIGTSGPTMSQQQQHLVPLIKFTLTEQHYQMKDEIVNITFAFSQTLTHLHVYTKVETHAAAISFEFGQVDLPVLTHLTWSIAGEILVVDEQSFAAAQSQASLETLMLAIQTDNHRYRAITPLDLRPAPLPPSKNFSRSQLSAPGPQPPKPKLTVLPRLRTLGLKGSWVIAPSVLSELLLKTCPNLEVLDLEGWKAGSLAKLIALVETMYERTRKMRKLRVGMHRINGLSTEKMQVMGMFPMKHEKVAGKDVLPIEVHAPGNLDAWAYPNGIGAEPSSVRLTRVLLLLLITKGRTHLSELSTPVRLAYHLGNGTQDLQSTTTAIATSNITTDNTAAFSMDYLAHLRHLDVEWVAEENYHSAPNIKPTERLKIFMRGDEYEQMMSLNRLLEAWVDGNGLQGVRLWCLWPILRREVTWTIAMPIMEQLQSLVIPVSDIRRYHNAIDRLSNLEQIRCSLDEPCDYSEEYNSDLTAKFVNTTQQRKSEALAAMVAFVKKHTQLFPARLQFVTCTNGVVYNFEEQECPKEILSEIAQLLPTLSRPLYLDDSMSSIGLGLSLHSSGSNLALL